MIFHFLNFPCANFWWSLCSRKISNVCATSYIFVSYSLSLSLSLYIYIYILCFILLVHIFRYIYYIKVGIITILCFFVPKLKSVLKWSSLFLHCFVTIMVIFGNSPSISRLLLFIILNLWQENILVLQALGWMVLKCLYVVLQLTLSPLR